MNIKIPHPHSHLFVICGTFLLACLCAGLFYWRGRIEDVYSELRNLRGRQVNRYFCEEQAVRKEVIGHLTQLLEPQWRDKDFRIESMRQVAPQIDQAFISSSENWSAVLSFLKRENQEILKFRATDLKGLEAYLEFEANCQTPYPWITRFEPWQPVARPLSPTWKALADQWEIELAQVAKKLPGIKRQIIEDEKIACGSAKQLVQTIQLRDHLVKGLKKRKTSNLSDLRIRNLFDQQARTLRDNVSKFSLKWGLERARASCLSVLIKGDQTFETKDLEAHVDHFIRSHHGSFKPNRLGER
ncbi:MAG: hypothetical protein JNM39_07855 [Bdellovibrionaceae bacterium]|nr:hypothetical protein [Pseudobdellovibrionaceae bacterium]